MKKLSQNKRIVIAIIVLILISLSGIYLVLDEPIDGFTCCFIGFANGYFTHRWASRWQYKDNKKS